VELECYRGHNTCLLIVWCFSYLLHYVLSSLEYESVSIQYYGFALACLLVALIAFGKTQNSYLLNTHSLKGFDCSIDNIVFFLGRIYLGMHSVVDIVSGLAIGVLILGLWLTVNEKLDDFITSKQNGKLLAHSLIKLLSCKH